MSSLTQASTLAIARLRAYKPPALNAYSSLPWQRRASVLLLLFADNHGDLRVVLTLRASNMNTYSGQVSLPGGKADFDAETPFQTARREAEEEIGLPRERLPQPYQIEHLCELPTHLAVTELGVRPCVAYLHTGDNHSKGSNIEENMIPRLNAKEVAAVFTAPFERFLSDGSDDPPPPEGQKRQPWYQGIWNKWNNDNWRMHNFYMPKQEQVTAQQSHDTYRVWGLTAAMLVGAAQIAYGRQPDFEHKQEIGEETMIKRLLDIGRLTAEKKKGSKISREDARAASPKNSKTNL